MVFTIDSGTSTTRIKVFDGQSCIFENSISLSLKSNSLQYSKKTFIKTVKLLIKDTLKKTKIKENLVEAILVSGMITSKLGHFFTEHIKTPTNLTKLSENLKKIEIEKITKIPFFIIPGVECSENNSQDLHSTDMMRGEETEVMGIIELLKPKASFIAVLPGSHIKFIEVDDDKNIVNCQTSLSGEMIAALSENTVLNLSLELFDKFSQTFLTKGYEFSLKHGLNAALFKVRVLDVKFKISRLDIYSFFLGVILASDIKTIKENIKNQTVIIGGKSPIKEALYFLLKNFSNKNIILLTDKEVDLTTSIGALKIYRQSKKQRRKYESNL